MCHKLPVGNFQWIKEKELGEIQNLIKSGKWDLVPPCHLEVDLDYPKELHGLHNDYPLAPESMKVDGVRKLITNLNNKEKYVLHFEA